MTKPTLYTVKTETGSEGQAYFEQCDWNAQSRFDQCDPLKAVDITRLQTRAAIVVTTDPHFKARFDKLPLEFSIPPRHDFVGKGHLIPMQYRLRYALDPELDQLFSFLIREQKLRHEDALTRKHNHICDQQMKLSDVKMQLSCATEANQKLEAEVASLKRPWYVKLLSSIFGG